MCGISGWLSWGSRPGPTYLVVMTDHLSHRGHDFGAVTGFDNIVLGHRRLAIINLSDAGRQPMSDQSGNVWITFNGEIYNYPQLRTDLEAKGHRFRSASDK